MSPACRPGVRRAVICAAYTRKRMGKWGLFGGNSRLAGRYFRTLSNGAGAFPTQVAGVFQLGSRCRQAVVLHFRPGKLCLASERLARLPIPRYHPRFDFSGVSEDRLSNCSATALSARATFGDLSGAAAPPFFKRCVWKTKTSKTHFLTIIYASPIAMMAVLVNLNPRSVCFWSG